MSALPSAKTVGIDDKYSLSAERIYISGIQALVRLPMMQRERDRAAQLNTAGYISGYRGSPLGGYDNALWKAKNLLAEHDVRFQPGLNEDLAATALWGSQQVGMFPGAKVDGVFGIWYGKGPGVDRSMDALKHANMAGTSINGGVIAVAGDDHNCQSSSLPHQSEQVFAAAMIPVLNPATVQEYLDFGLLGFALSRFSGCWVGFKAVSETVESSSSVYADADRIKIVIPSGFSMPKSGLSIRWPDPPLEMEARLHGPKMAAVAAFARANALDRVVFGGKRSRLGIVTTGKAYLDVRQALSDLGLSDADATTLGISIYKVALAWPLEPTGVLEFAGSVDEVLVVEEKRGFIEDQLIRYLYQLHASHRPLVVGKRDEQGAVLIPSGGQLSPTLVAAAIVARLKRLGHGAEALELRLARLRTFDTTGQTLAPSVVRSPYYCSGCPHNTSTRLPDGSRAGGGIGCHGMAVFYPGRTTTNTHMGAEGANWIGQAPFTAEPHVFQNIGDGTYAHSGILAIRAAAAAGVNITYKLLYNDAVAMTGGQPVEGNFTVGQVAAQLAAEGAKRIAVLSDEPEKYPVSGYFPPGVAAYHRDELDRVQKELRETAGLTILIYDQTCAAEKRRRRKKGLYPDPAKRVFINDLVCEGCGDCSKTSNCVSVKPLETEFGRKRRIDQSNCNKDFSCVNGFCPSFVTVNGGALRKPKNNVVFLNGNFVSELPLPETKPIVGSYNVLITGIGGTGVITLGALLGMAAHLEGKGCTVLDFTGLAQKNGAVMSHVRIAGSPEALAAVRIGSGGADLLLGCDMVVAASATSLSRINPGTTRAVINDYVEPTAGFVLNPDSDLQGDAMRQTLRQVLTDSGINFVDGTGLATALIGDSIAGNLFMLGYAFQRGFLPLSLKAITDAIALNGTAIAINHQAFAFGRLAAHAPEKIAAMAAPALAALAPQEKSDLRDTIARRGQFLADYQDANYADRYRTLVARVEAAEAAKAGGSHDLSEAVARNFFKLMAYKDEYEVARLYTNGDFMQKLNLQFEGNVKLNFHFAPPIFNRRDPETGHLKKQTFGPWMFPLLKVLGRLKFLRGGPLDLFGFSEERRADRQLIVEYEKTVQEIIQKLESSNYRTAVEIARIPENIRGFGHIREAGIAAAKASESSLLKQFRGRSIPLVAVSK